MRFRITTFAEDGARITQDEQDFDCLEDAVVVSMIHSGGIDADATRLVIDELGEDGEPVTKTEV